MRGFTDSVAVELKGLVRLQLNFRFRDSDNIPTMYQRLIDISFNTYQNIEIYSGENSVPIARITHFSIQEYLESSRTLRQGVAIFSLSSVTAYAKLTQIYSIYLLEHNISSSNLNSSLQEGFPLAHFAATYWCRHYQATEDTASQFGLLILKSFQRQRSFVTWVTTQYGSTLENSY